MRGGKTHPGRKRQQQAAHSKCANCTTDRYPIVARGLCTRCYPVTLKIEKLQKGNLKPLGNLRAMRLHRAHPQVEKLRLGFIRQYRRRLEFLRLREEQRRGEHLDAMTIERILRDLGRGAGARDEPHYNAATRIRHDFPGESRIALFRLLHEIEERIRWQPDIYRALTEKEE